MQTFVKAYTVVNITDFRSSNRVKCNATDVLVNDGFIMFYVSQMSKRNILQLGP